MMGTHHYTSPLSIVRGVMRKGSQGHHGSVKGLPHPPGCHLSGWKGTYLGKSPLLPADAGADQGSAPLSGFQDSLSQVRRSLRGSRKGNQWG